MTKPPRWLELTWEHAAPEAPQSGSLEQRAKRVIAMYQDNQLRAPHLLQALALDLVFAKLGDNFPKVLEQLLVLALGLPKGHEVGGWVRQDLDGRGKPDREAQALAWVTD